VIFAALPNAAGGDEPDADGATAGAANASRPAKVDREGKSDILIGEKLDGVLQGLGLGDDVFHAHILALVGECVKYIVARKCTIVIKKCPIDGISVESS
jgi:hypothetical protein